MTRFYLQHADHFTRILNERQSFKKEKFSETTSENTTNFVEENTEKNLDKELVEKPNDEIKIEKSEKTQVEIN